MTSQAANTGSLISFKFCTSLEGADTFPQSISCRLSYLTMGNSAMTNHHVHLTHLHATSPPFFTVPMNFRNYLKLKKLGWLSVAFLRGHKGVLCVPNFSPVSHSTKISWCHLKPLTKNKVVNESDFYRLILAHLPI